MRKIGIRELKNQATQVVRAVREEAEAYVITVQGEPVAVLRPITEADKEELRQADVRRFLADLDELSKQVTAAWESDLTAAEAVAEQRREL